MDLAIAGASAVIVPGFVAPLAKGLPGGAFAPALLGAVMLFASTKTDGVVKSVLAGAGAGMVAATIVPAIVRVTA